MKNNHDVSSEWAEWSREDLVKEYLETKIANIVNWVGVKWHHMPKDVSKDPVYWKSKDKDLHNLHCEIAKRYHITRDDCLWLENIVDSDNLYVMDYKLKSLIEVAIKNLEKCEKEKGCVK